MPNAAAATQMKASSAMLLGNFVAQFKAVALASGRYIPRLRVIPEANLVKKAVSAIPAPVSPPPPLAPPPADTTFCKIGKKDGTTCLCALNACVGAGCATEHGVTYYTKWDKDAKCTEKKSGKTTEPKAAAPVSPPPPLAPPPAPAPPAAAPAPKVFCKIGKTDEFGSCHCALHACKGAGCATEHGMTYYTKWDEGAECTQAPAVAADLDQVVPEAD